MLSDKCFVYCNGLMDHLCPCYPNSATTTTTVGALTNGGDASRLMTAGGGSFVGGPTIGPRGQALPHYAGTLDALAKISRHEGVRTLWSGLGPTLVLAIPATVIYFVFYEQLRVRMKDEYFRRNPGEGFLCVTIGKICLKADRRLINCYVPDSRSRIQRAAAILHTAARWHDGPHHIRDGGQSDGAGAHENAVAAHELFRYVKQRTPGSYIMYTLIY